MYLINHTKNNCADKLWSVRTPQMVAIYQAVILLESFFPRKSQILKESCSIEMLKEISPSLL